VRGGSWGGNGIRWGVVAHTNGAVRRNIEWGYILGNFAGPRQRHLRLLHVCIPFFFAVE
jgi:hypothetical protein